MPYSITIDATDTEQLATDMKLDVDQFDAMTC